MGLTDFNYTRTLFAQRTMLGGLVDVLLKIRGLIFIPFFTRLLGAEGMGIYAVVLSAATILLIPYTLNTITGLVVYTSPLKGKELIRRNYSTVLNSNLFFVAITSMLLIIVWNGVLPGYEGYLAITLLFSYSVFGRTVTVVFPQMFQRTKLTALLMVLTEYCGALFAISLVVLGFGAVGLIAGLAVVNLISTIVMLVLIFRDVGYEYRIDGKTFREITRFSLPLVPANFSQAIMESMDKFVLLLFLGPAVVGVYQVAWIAGSTVLIVSSAIGFTGMYTFAKLWSDDKKEFRELGRWVTRWLIFTTVVLTVLLIVFKDIIILVLGGAEYVSGATVVPVLGFAMCSGAVGAVFVAMLSAAKLSMTIMKTYIVFAVIDTALNFILIPVWGMMGAAFSTALGGWLAAITLSICVEKRFKIGFSLSMLRPPKVAEIRELINIVRGGRKIEG